MNNTNLHRSARPTTEDARSAGQSAIAAVGPRGYASFAKTADEWIQQNVSSRAVPSSSEEQFAKTMRIAFMEGAQKWIVDHAAWHGSNWTPMSVRFAAANEYEDGLPRRPREQTKAAYEAFLDNAKREFLRGLDRAIEVRERQQLPMEFGHLQDLVETGQDNLNTLTEVFGWLHEMLATMSGIASQNDLSDASKLHKIGVMTQCARFLAEEWQATACSMARNIGYAETSPRNTRVDLESAARALIPQAVSRPEPMIVNEVEHA